MQVDVYKPVVSSVTSNENKHFSFILSLSQYFVPSATVLALIVKISRLMFIANITLKGATRSLVDHVVEPSSVDNAHLSAPEITSDHSQQLIPKIASDAHQHTRKGNYCACVRKSMIID